MNEKNRKASKVFLAGFFIVSVLDIIGIASSVEVLQIVCKPLIIPLLMLTYYFSSADKNKGYLVALFFSFLGDVFLLDKSNMFMFGIAAFLITQIIYIFIIVKQMKKPSSLKKYLYAFLFANYVVYLVEPYEPFSSLQFNILLLKFD